MGQKKTVITCLSANHSGAPYIEVYACYRATSMEVLKKKSQAHQVQIFIETRAY
jgi:hypothetical protein